MKNNVLQVILGRSFYLFLALSATATIPITQAAESSDAEQSDNARQMLDTPASQISPARKINHRKDRAEQKRKRPKPSPDTRKQYRTIDGSSNNLTDETLGTTHSQLTRLFSPDYADGISSLAGQHRPSARDVSNHVVALDFDGESIKNRYLASDFLWQWGQFIDHDIDLTDGADPAEAANILVPSDDALFLPGSEIPFNRSIYDAATGSSTENPRQQLNEITAWIDASNVYGSDPQRAEALRAMDGTGELKISAGNLMPFNTFGLPNAGDNGSNSEQLFLAGDVRANEQIGLTVMHTLFMREHNRLAQKLKAKHPNWSGEKVYQRTRQLVGGMMQSITYNEFLPALLGKHTLQRYRGYDVSIDPNVSNVFSTAAYRFGHSALSDTLLRVDKKGDEIAAGHLPLRRAFFSPYLLSSEGDLDPVLRGLAKQQCQKVDNYLVEDVRSFLFGDPSAGGFDLAALNIQRGRDHGLPSYNTLRQSIGLPVVTDFNQISRRVDVQRGLRNAYATVDDIDAWVGGLAEDPLRGSHLGLLFTIIIKEQFEALRDGDRFWYQNALSRKDQRFVERSTLAKIIKRNTGVGKELQKNVFYVSSHKKSKQGYSERVEQEKNYSRKYRSVSF